jgi:hypothetical protein
MNSTSKIPVENSTKMRKFSVKVESHKGAKTQRKLTTYEHESKNI